jgi:hypothetical protein
MTRIPGLSHVHTLVSTYLPNLSRPQLATLALWSFAMVVTQSAGLTTVVAFLSLVLGQAEPIVCQRLRHWYSIQTRVRKQIHRTKRRAYRKRRRDVQTCFAPLLRWVVAWWDPNQPCIPLALDASTLGQRFTILAVCVVIRGSAIPVAWKIVEATKKGAWQPHWEALIATLHDTIPADWKVIVLADRGLYAKWLYEIIQWNGWHPFLRINRQGQYCLEGEDAFRLLSTVVIANGERWSGRVRCFKTEKRQLDCTLVACKEAGYRDPWLVVTDLAPEEVDIAWYGLRSWIECGFRDSKRGGWHWELTKMVRPEHAEWLWLAIAVATLWTVAVGCVADHAAEETHWFLMVRRANRPPERTLSCFRRGRIMILAALCLGQAMPEARLIPEPWPSSSAATTQEDQPLAHAA